LEFGGFDVVEFYFGVEASGGEEVAVGVELACCEFCLILVYAAEPSCLENTYLSL
jgi:hypothetical protein